MTSIFTKRIAISGAAGFGKTTTVERISDTFGIPFVKEFSRTILGDELILKPCDYPEKKGGALGFQREVIRRKVEVENRLISEDKPFIADRALIDCGAYTLYFYATHENQEAIREMVDFTIARTKSVYHHVFLMPFTTEHFTSGTFDNDGIRSDKMGYHRMIYNLILGMLKDNDIPYTILPYKLEEAFQVIQSWIITQDEVIAKIKDFFLDK